MGAPTLELVDIRKEFGKVKALDGVSFKAEAGQCIAILGENGAGKTSLASVLIGLYHPTSGAVKLHGKDVLFRGPPDSLAAGIGMIHQHFSLVERMSAIENILIGLPADKRGPNAPDKIRELGQDFGFEIDYGIEVGKMPVGMRQRVEILKALYRDVRILILDEPTSVLAPNEVAPFLAGVRQLVEAGRTVFFITHKLDEIMEAADRVLVMRHGRIEGDVLTTNTNPSELSEMMMGSKGKESILEFERTNTARAETVLSVKNVSALSSNGSRVLDDVSLTINAGEILGIAGIDGNGQKELSDVIGGLMAAEDGEVHLTGRDITRLNVADRLEAGIGFVPEDRHAEGLVLSLSVADNLAFRTISKAPFSRNGRINRAAITTVAKKTAESFDIRPRDTSLPVSGLSGGNQQKVALAREIAAATKLLVVVQPTKGLDVGATEFVQLQIRVAAERGVAVLYISTELEHVLAVSDRVAVMAFGRITGYIDPKSVNLEQVGLLMTAANGAAA
ncbi:ABC transporter ATP-binding protein [Roseibium sp. SCP14]|uniref:ABC transporter ATP-binding protein n=1 Tax=Roseibium sp. SCP14 TaxID=3141375 RepID=UPI003334F163